MLRITSTLGQQEKKFALKSNLWLYTSTSIPYEYTESYDIQPLDHSRFLSPVFMCVYSPKLVITTDIYLPSQLACKNLPNMISSGARESLRRRGGNSCQTGSVTQLRPVHAVRTHIPVVYYSGGSKSQRKRILPKKRAENLR